MCMYLTLANGSIYYPCAEAKNLVIFPFLLYPIFYPPKGCDLTWLSSYITFWWLVTISNPTTNLDRGQQTMALWAKYSLQPVFVNKVLIKHCHTPCFYMSPPAALGPELAEWMAELWWDPYGPQNLFPTCPLKKILLTGPIRFSTTFSFVVLFLQHFRNVKIIISSLDIDHREEMAHRLYFANPFWQMILWKQTSNHNTSC